jgi:hypothetical protein
MKMPFAAAHESGYVQVFGRRDDGPIHALRWPASEKRQGTKSREVSSGGAAGNWCRGRYGDFATGSGAHVMTRSGSEARFASLAGRKLKHDRAAGVLSDEILCLLVVIAQQSGVARQASALSAKSRHRR